MAITTTTVKKTTTPIAQTLNASNDTSGKSPALGYGAAVYGSSAADNAAIMSNAQKLASDPNFKGSEIQRTQDVIAARKAQRLDTTGQEKYLTVNLGYTPQSATTTDPSANTPGSSAYIENLRKLATEGANQTAYDNRNQADAVNLQNAQGLQEIMSNRGLGASGENITATLNQNAQRANSLYSINNQLSSDLRGIDSDYNSNMLNDLYRTQDNAFRDKTFDSDQAQRAWENQFNQGQFDWNKVVDKAGLTGNYGDSRTLEGQNADLNKQNTLFNQQMAQKQFDQDVQQFGLNYALQKQSHQQDNALGWANYGISKQNADRLSSGGGEDPASVSQLTSLWKITNKAPAGLEKYGIKQGDPYPSGEKASVWDNIKNVIGGAASTLKGNGVFKGSTTDSEISQYVNK